MSRLVKILANLKNYLSATGSRATFVGADQHGNKYFETIEDKQRNLRASRYIEERKEHAPHDHPEVPVEWESWLRGRRKNPPTQEEIQRNYAKMMKAKMKGEELDKKYTEIANTEALPEVSQNTEITENVASNPQRVSFPMYDDYETKPGQKYPRGNKDS